MNQPLLTVIVPCYNVEKYADKCISSIVEQSYLNLEILLIDDGSTDETGKLCDAWQMKDQRIRVIHKQNEGLAYARKTGIENANADYVAFVDSDDWIDKDMYSDLMSALLSTNSDIADSDFCIVYDDGRIVYRDREYDAQTTTMEHSEGAISILKDKNWRTSFGIKIFRKKLFEHIVFPKGLQYGEDLIVFYLFHHASKTVFINKPYYFYQQRSGSISKKDDIRRKIKNGYDWCNTYYDIYAFVKQHSEYNSVFQHVKNVIIWSNMELLHSMVEYKQYSTKQQFVNIAQQLRSVFLTKEDRLQFEKKIELFLIRTNINLYRFLRTMYHQMIHITNRLKITNRQIFVFITD